MSTQPLLLGEEIIAAFGVELHHSRSEVSEIPPNQPAAEMLRSLEFRGDEKRIEEIETAALEVSSVVNITRTGSETNGDAGILDIFTAGQILEMQQRMHDYLGMTLPDHLESLRTPQGYPFYVGRLATYFASSNDDVTSQFGGFRSRHEEPRSKQAIGPREANSREYANWANVEILRQFKDFYQADFSVALVGPSKPVEGSRVSWERGVAECQFLVLDYVRDELALNSRSSAQRNEAAVMSIEDVEYNLVHLTVNRTQVVQEVQTINPMLAAQLDTAIGSLPQFTVEVFHRGRLGVPMFRKYPEKARKAIEKVELLLVQAAALAATMENQEDIPILELE